MNGRIYDPLLGRFLSADTFVQFPGSLQSYNRYSYVSNNPLSLVDPTGWWEVQLFGLKFSSTDNVFTRSVGAVKSRDRSASVGELKFSFTLQTAKGNLEQYPARLQEFGQKVANDLETKGPIMTLVEDFGAGPKVATTLGGPLLRTLGLDGAVLASDVVRVDAAAISGTLALANQMARSDIKPGDGSTIEPRKPSGENRPELTHNPKHHQNSKSPEPKNAEDLYNKSIVDKNGVRWSVDKDGTIHRFAAENNGKTHWNGSTEGKKPIRQQDIPNDIKKQLEEELKRLKEKK